ncbi:lipid-A-disaccharide synthase [Hyphococcus sp. DH-69]|uniref:lipid-A-disaccharide synthase n=1 Tax=Hyphococcus formosus TaxID=3143534 RepID=UPI00398AA3A0
MTEDKRITIMISAVEPSADALGASLIQALKSQNNNIEFVGCGGPMMAQAGLASIFPIEQFSVMGPVDALRALPAAIKAAMELAAACVNHRADAAIFIDSWAFSKLAAKQVRKLSPSTACVKYVAPQVWASRPNRAKSAASLFDLILCLFEFEAPYFEKHGLRAQWVGHSGFQEIERSRYSGASFRKTHGLPSDTPLLAILPGSRRGEVERLSEPFGKAVALISKRVPELRTVVVAAPNVSRAVSDRAVSWAGNPIIISRDERLDAFAAADAALAASGTVVTELAIQKTPIVVSYKVGPVAAAWARHVITSPYVSLVNIAAGRAVVPEFLQEECIPEKMADSVADLLQNEDARMGQLVAFSKVLPMVTGGSEPAENKAARAVLSLIEGK